MNLEAFGAYAEAVMLSFMLLMVLMLPILAYTISGQRRRRLLKYVHNRNYALLKLSEITAVKKKYGFDKGQLIFDLNEVVAWSKSNLSGLLFDFTSFPSSTGELILAGAIPGARPPKMGTSCTVEQLISKKIDAARLNQIAEAVCPKIQEALHTINGNPIRVSLTYQFGPLCIVSNYRLEGERGFDTLIEGAVSLAALLNNQP